MVDPSKKVSTTLTKGVFTLYVTPSLHSVIYFFPEEEQLTPNLMLTLPAFPFWWELFFSL